MEQKQEMTYIDQLMSLHDSVQIDGAIPAVERRSIMKHISALQEILWKYSA